MTERAYVVGTFDTKHAELTFLAERLRAAGVAVVTVDLSTRTPAGDTDIGPKEVAAHHPTGAAAVLGLDDRGKAVGAMAEAAVSFIATRSDIGGIIGAGGTGNTALVAPMLRALPIGLPKVLVSTVASGNTAPYVGPADIMMLYSVTDVQGLNRISRRVLGNAANALAGMMKETVPEPSVADKPAIGLTMFGVTTPCVQVVCRALEADYDCLVFHATGTGGRSMEKLVENGLIAAVLDITTTETCDLLMGGVFSAGEERLEAVIATGTPWIGSVGALDMVNFGAMDTVPGHYRDRNLYVHNPQVTLMRTTVEENRRMGEWLAGKLNRMTGPVRLLLPEGGVSLIDAPDMPFHDPEADAALFTTLEGLVRQTPDRRIIRRPEAINDPGFAAALVDEFRSVVAAREGGA